MKRRSVRLVTVLGLALLGVLLASGAAANLYADILWYAGLGYEDLLWTRIGTVIVVRLVAGLVAGAVVLANLWLVVRHLGPVHLRRRYGNLEIAEQVPRRYIMGGMVIVAAAGGWWLSGLLFPESMALSLLALTRRVAWGLQDPVFGRDVSWFVFALPVYAHLILFLLIVTVWSLILSGVGYTLVGALRVRNNRLELDETPRLHLAVLVATLVLLFGVHYWLGRYGILFGGTGFSGGTGYTDVVARLPAQRVIAALAPGVAIAIVYGAWRRLLWPPLTAVVILVVAMITLGQIYPSIIQKFRVEPNQLERETEYIRWNIDFTRQAFGLESLERRTMPYRAASLGSWQDLAPILERLTLWDAEQLGTQFNKRALYAYYQVPRVHDDRYGPPDNIQPVALSVREFAPEGLGTEQATWRTLHLNVEQVRGAGVLLTPTAQKADNGDPIFWLDELAPVVRDSSAPEDVRLERESVFFGTTPQEYLIVGPSDTLAIGPDGALPGVPVSSLLRRLVFAWHFSEQNLLFAGELNRESHVIFRRRVGERVERLAPFLVWDPEPMPVLHEGRVVWLIDGYSTTAMFPIASPASLPQGPSSVMRYLRNSVKATVDGLTGEVAFYAVADAEPILETWRRVFPELIQPLDAMPASLRAHLKYPDLYAQLQANLLTSYHVDDPAVFFAGQNEWAIPAQAGTGGNTGARPVHMIIRPPGETREEFWLMLPFIARGRPTMTAILLVRNGPEGYGESVLLQLPRDQQVPGPTQVRANIEQNPQISSQLSLLRSAGGGSTVELGRLRVVPMDSTFIYVMPVFLVAQGGTEALPQLQTVVVSDGTAVNMAPTLREAVEGLYGGAVRPTVRPQSTPAVIETEDWAAEALRLLEQAEQRLRAGDYAGFGAALNRLRDALRRASGGGV